MIHAADRPQSLTQCASLIAAQTILAFSGSRSKAYCHTLIF